MLAVLALLTTAALAIVTNYATQNEPTWLKDHPTVVWIALAALIILGAWLTGRAARPDGSGHVRPKRRWLGLRRNARMMHCLARGKKLLVPLNEGESGTWRCAKCSRQSVASVDSAARVTIATVGYGKVRYVQRTQLFGLLTKVYQSEVLEHAEPATAADRNDRDVMDPGSTVISRSIDGMFKREFRAAFIRGLLLDRWKRIIGWSIVGSFLVPLGQAHGPLQFGWHLALGFGICAMLGVGQVWLRGWRTFGKWTSSAEALYGWLQRPDGIALAIVTASADQWHFMALRILGGRGTQKLGVELMQDICRYADRNGLTLSINASDPEWLIDKLRFERAMEQRRRGYSTLIRRPSRKRERPGTGHGKRRRPDAPLDN